MNVAKSVIIFNNGNIAVFDEQGQQMPELQESWLNFEAMRKLAEVIVRDKPSVEGAIPLPQDPLTDYIRYFRDVEARRNPKS